MVLFDHLHHLLEKNNKLFPFLATHFFFVRIFLGLCLFICIQLTPLWQDHGHFSQNSDIPKAIGLSNSYRNIGLTYLSDQQHWNSYSSIGIGHKMRNFYYFLCLSSLIFHRSEYFLANFRRTHVFYQLSHAAP